MHPGIIIKQLRKERNISRNELAQKSGLSFTFISALEREAKEPTVLSIRKICNAFEITIQKFFDYDLDIKNIETMKNISKNNFEGISANDLEFLLNYFSLSKENKDLISELIKKLNH